MTGAVRPAQAAPVGRVESRPLSGGYSSSALPAPPSRYQTAAVHPLTAAPEPRTKSTSRTAAASGIHVVGPGETLITISRKYDKPRNNIARANGIKPAARLRVGQRLTIPGVPQAKIKAARTAAAEAKAKQVEPKAAPAPKTPQRPHRQVASLGAPPSNLKLPAEERVERAQIAQPAAEATLEAKNAQPAATGASPNFRWPVRGRVIAGFGPKPNGQQNDGINLSVPEGTSVKAAEDGVVAYAGNELKGYGNLVLVRHSNGYVTAYAHASELKVKRGDPVKRGQIIALAGQTGSVRSPQLHFEIRKGSSPVDPMPYLGGN
ncbi:MAG TPA: peptidoglycan DD-metalloendopeptidase family protein [Xanthobacteraceae bacterium]|nr:peptidoglycan DD-metalloendopeptidase family protein [Xanthobacteraceae bacterium]